MTGTEKYGYKIARLKAMIDADNGWGARLYHADEGGSPLTIEVGAIRVLLSYYEGLRDAKDDEEE